MKILERISLAPYTTFQVGGKGRYLIEVGNETELESALEFAREKSLPTFVLGGGSNIIVSDAGFDGLVIKMAICDVAFDGEIARVSAGKNWDAFVAETVARGLWGLENLSGIPGTVGASPVQNIGAYGVEVREYIESVRAVHVEIGEVREFTNVECRFGYRDSYFKTTEGKKWAITSVSFRLSRTPRPRLEYRDLSERFGSATNVNPSQSEIRNAILEIRARKFPDLAKIGTAGSFWKNPIVSKERFAELSAEYPGMPSFQAVTRDGGEAVKIPLAWILDKVCGLKGASAGAAVGEKSKVRLFENQPLVLVAERGTTAAEIDTFADDIAEDVRSKTGIDIEREVGFLGRI